jgi:hypothetical protein
MIVLPVGDAERAWVAAALSLPNSALERAVRMGGGEPRTAEFEVETMVVSMNAEQQADYERALGVARRLIGYDKREWQLREVIAMEYLGSHAEHAPEPVEREAPRQEPDAYAEWLEVWAERGRSVEGQILAHGMAEELVEDPGSLEDIPPFEIDSRIQALIVARRTFDEPFGRALEHFFRHRLWAVLGYRKGVLASGRGAR